MIDRPKVTKYLRRIPSKDLLFLGESLGLDGTELRSRVNSDTFLFDLIGDWLSRKHRVDQVGRPSWNRLVVGLEEIGETGLASDIKTDLGL